MEFQASFSPRLVDDCVEGNTLAWRELHRRYFPIASAFLRKLGVRERDVEDAAQEVFLQVHKYLPRFRREAELSTWLYRICITQARQARRRARVSETLLSILSLVPAEQLVSAPSFCEDAARRRVEQALSALPAGERAAFVLYEMEGVPGKQIAEILNCPEATVWRRLHYARETFCRALGAKRETGASGFGKRLTR